MNIRAVAPLAVAAIVTTLYFASGYIRSADPVTQDEAVALVQKEDPTSIVADQIRAQGYKCDSPQSATRDPQASKPDEAVWILDCESGSYRVRLVPDMAATVEKIEKGGGDGK